MSINNAKELDEITSLALITNEELQSAKTGYCDLGVAANLTVIKILRMVNHITRHYSSCGTSALTKFEFNPKRRLDVNGQLVYEAPIHLRQSLAGTVVIIPPQKDFYKWQGGLAKNILQGDVQGRNVVAESIKKHLLKAIYHGDDAPDYDKEVPFDFVTCVYDYDNRRYAHDTAMFCPKEVRCLYEILKSRDSKKLKAKYGDVYEKFAPVPVNAMSGMMLTDLKKKIVELGKSIDGHIEALRAEERQKRQEVSNWFYNQVGLFKQEEAEKIDGEKAKIMEMAGRLHLDEATCRDLNSMFAAIEQSVKNFY